MITHEGVAKCTEDTISAMAEDQKIKRCSNAYTEEELSILTDVGSLIAGFKCFQDSFNQACGDYLRSQIEHEASSSVTQPEPAGRFLFGKLACLATCRQQTLPPPPPAMLACFSDQWQ